MAPLLKMVSRNKKPSRTATDRVRGADIPDARSRTDAQADGQQLHDIRTIARRLAVNKKTIHRFISRGKLRAHRIGRQLRVSEEDLRRFLQENRYRPRAIKGSSEE